MLRPFIAKRLCELAQGALCGSIRRDCEPALKSEKGAKIDNLAPSKGDHVSPRRLGEQPDRFEVDVEDLKQGKLARKEGQ